MALVTEEFSADGTQKTFTVSNDILSESHCRVHFYYDKGLGDGLTDYEVTSSDWDLLGLSTIVFDDAPTSGYIVKITTSSDGTGLDTSPSEISDVAHNLDAITFVSENLDKVTWIAEVYYGESASEPTLRRDGVSALQKGDLYFNTTDDAMSVYTGTEWWDFGFGYTKEEIDAFGFATPSTVLELSGGTMTGAITGVVETKVAMGASDIDLSAGNLFTKTITADTTLTVSNTDASGNVHSFILEVTNGSAYAITWFSGVKWANGGLPILTLSGTDILGFYSHDGGVTWRGHVIATDSK